MSVPKHKRINPEFKRKRTNAEFRLKPSTINKMEWILKDSQYAECFRSETSLVEQCVDLMYLAMVDKKYNSLLTTFLECPVPNVDFSDYA